MIERSKKAALRALALLTLAGLRRGITAKLQQREARIEALYRLRLDGLDG